MVDGIEGLAESLPGGDVKIGGKSIYLYGGAIAAVAVIYMWWNNRGQTQEADNAVAADGGYSVPDVSGDLGDLPVSTTGDNQDLDVAGPTNDEWSTKAIAWLTLQGINPLSSQRAIALYFQGDKLDYTQTNIVNKAVAQFGAPPEGLFGPPDITDTAPVAAKPKPVAWSSKLQKWRAVGTVKGYRAPSLSASRWGTYKAGTRIITKQTAVNEGVRWVRKTSGVVFLASDLRPETAADLKKK